jgi:hypothetical protein
MSDALVCTSCATPHPSSERFCPDCGLPLVHSPEVAAAAPAPTSAQQRARKVQARYADGPLVRVAAARHQSEAEFLQGLLLEEGIPSLLRRSGGFDVPDFLAAGPRDILVPQSGALAAREALGTTAPPLGSAALPLRGSARPWVRALAAALAVLVVAFVAAGVMAAIWP